MNQYRIRYTILTGGGTREEVVNARGDYEARRVVESRYAPGQIFIVTVVKIS